MRTRHWWTKATSFTRQYSLDHTGGFVAVPTHTMSLVCELALYVMTSYSKLLKCGQSHQMFDTVNVQTLITITATYKGYSSMEQRATIILIIENHHYILIIENTDLALDRIQ